MVILVNKRGETIRPIFRRSSTLGVRTIICILFAIALIVSDKNFSSFQRVKLSLEVMVLPIQYLVDFPITIIRWLADSVTTQQALLMDNARLRAHELLLQSKLQKLLALKRENAQLRGLLNSTFRVDGRVLVSQLLAVDLSPALHQVVVNKGKERHVYLGQPVLDAYGVLGQVVRVGAFTSKVLLVTDPKSAVPVESVRNDIRAIAVGMGSSLKLRLRYVSMNSDIRAGDIFVASGMGLRYPPGYPVGVVLSVERSAHDSFLSVILRPLAHLNRSQQVLLAWPSPASLTKAVRNQLKANIPDAT